MSAFHPQQTLAIGDRLREKGEYIDELLCKNDHPEQQKKHATDHQNQSSGHIQVMRSVVRPLHTLVHL